jgi:hypothetical protein
MRANQWTIDPRAVVVMPDHVYMTFTPDQILRAKKYSGGLELQEPSRALQRTESTGSLVGLDDGGKRSHAIEFQRRLMRRSLTS